MDEYMHAWPHRRVDACIHAWMDGRGGGRAQSCFIYRLRYVSKVWKNVAIMEIGHWSNSQLCCFHINLLHCFVCLSRLACSSNLRLYLKILKQYFASDTLSQRASANPNGTSGSISPIPMPNQGVPERKLKHRMKLKPTSGVDFCSEFG